MAVLLCAWLGFSGCAQTPPQNFYRLSALDAAAANPVAARKSNLAIGIGPLRLADYLDQPSLACRRNDNQLELAEFHQWAGSLKDNLSSVLAENLGLRLGTEKVYTYPWRSSVPIDLQVTIEIISLDGILGDKARLSARWSLFEPQQKRLLVTRHSDLRQPVQGAAYLDLVAAQSRLLADLSQEIAGAINQARKYGMKTESGSGLNQSLNNN